MRVTIRDVLDVCLIVLTVVLILGLLGAINLHPL